MHVISWRLNLMEGDLSECVTLLYTWVSFIYTSFTRFYTRRYHHKFTQIRELSIYKISNSIFLINKLWFGVTGRQQLWSARAGKHRRSSRAEERRKRTAGGADPRCDRRRRTFGSPYWLHGLFAIKNIQKHLNSNM